ncbi:Ppx/GppA phosphatase family protein [Saccharothrix texasensis]|uniref:Exopolyphosphatase/guanosine-5'-triphosphate, 3'-diphosphate pyrophosphatase n=1 Tax=Saccharothrix texasensis TaxID=103734 RepID=A0A3N1HGG2_9PSEU|nr:exopolyphosphatase [Saccharothrix texasensis]ROP41609.1 exopolyphosphatase/guanosine-5'-triphosphate,3'-diphosphate pyrophosphatase [Saccharothrix texasensis]
MSGRPDQVGVLDVGCFSAHLVVVSGSPLHPVVSHKTRLRLDRALDRDNRLRPEGVEQVVTAVHAAHRIAERAGISALVPFATSVIRDASNAEQVISEVARRTGTRLRVLPGQEEARLAYRAARHWFGWRAGPLLVLDVGGGTVELAAGDDVEPSFTRSLPFGARTLTRRLALDRATPRDHRGLAKEQVLVHDRVVAALEGTSVGEHRAVGCSKVFQQLARLAGARPQHEGPFVPRALRLADLRGWIPRLSRMPVPRRARLPGISRHRAEQSLAGALVAEALMVATGYDEVEICPWSTREGLLLALLGAGDDDDEYCRVA